MSKTKQIIVTCLLTLLLVLLVGLIISLCCIFPTLKLICGLIFFGASVLGCIYMVGVMIHDFLFD